MKKIALSFGAAVLSVSLSPAVSAQTFDGPFIGAQAGWTQHDAGTFSTRLGYIAAVRSHDAVSAGVFAGYDHQIGSRFVIGTEVGLDFGIDDRFTRDTGAALVSVDPKRSIDFTARAGYLVTDNTLLYARGGYTNARFRTSIKDASGLRSASEDRDGWLVGGGVEHAFTDRISTRLEYRYSDLSDGRGKFDRHQALVGVAYRF